MQTPAWYYHRLRRMGGAEILWRLTGVAREATDLVRIPLRMFPQVAPVESLDSVSTGFTFVPQHNRLPADRLERLRAKAESILANRLSFFQHDQLFLGESIDWHRDWNQQLASPQGPCPLVDYRVAHVSGDCKQVWEPNRHHQLYVLARAWQQTGDVRYAEGAFRMFESWLDANPFGYGMNWKNPLELGVRVINWVFALDLLRNAPLDRNVWDRIHVALNLHVWDLARKFSRGSSANNHLVGEAAGAFVAAAWLPGLPDAGRIRRQAQHILAAEILKQFNADGGTSEQAIGYQFFSLQFFSVCKLVAERIGEAMPEAYTSRLSAAYGYLDAFAEGGNELPFYGDKDDGYVLDCGDASHDVEAAVAFGRALSGARSGCSAEAGFWLLDIPVVPVAAPTDRLLQSRSFPESGHYLLQSGSGEDRVSIQVDCAPLGYGSIAAHGHADALAFTLRMGGLLMLVDPGTYDYYTEPHWRNGFRHTRAHNTVCVDDQNQSELLGAFLWGRQTESRCLEWRSDGALTVLRGEHDGYRALPDPVSVERSFRFHADRRVLELEDVLEATGEHACTTAFHFHPGCEVSVEAGVVTATRAGQSLRIVLPGSVDVSVHRGDVSRMLGWFSSGYHRKEPSTTVVVGARLKGRNTWRYEISMVSAGEPAQIQSSRQRA